ncbi:MAG: zinc-binding dehydrogenase [Verrucomicrobia bacterium]|nr:zinc-binding dehydrogenase [Verrucomicrobiota bacterium]
MKAAVLIGPGRFCLQEIDIPEPRDKEVRIRIEGCGVCGSNLAPWEGRQWFKYPFAPGQPGHEGWGEINAVGAKVARWQVGDRVAALTYNAFAEFDVACEDAVVALPPSLEKKPFPGEALGCAMNVLRRCDIHPGQSVAIVGIGFMGALLTALAVRAGASVIALSRRPFALELARFYGATETIALEDHRRIIEQVKGLTDGAGCDRVIEAVGAQWPLDLAAELTRERGKLIIAGYHQDGPRQVNMQLWNWRGLDVINAHERDPNIYIRGMHDAVNAVATGEINPSPLYTHGFKIDRISEAFAAMQQRPDNFLKAFITT